MFRLIFTLFVAFVVASIFIASFSGCSSRRTTVETTTETQSADADRARYSATGDDGRVVEKTETTTVEKQD